MKQDRWKSPVLWASLLSASLLVGANLLGMELDANAVGQATTILLGFLVALGVVNNPTDRNSL